MKFALLLIAVAFLLVPCPALLACPSCKAALESADSATAFSFSVALMMAMPVLILMVWALLIFRFSKRPGQIVSLDEPQRSLATVPK